MIVNKPKKDKGDVRYTILYIIMFIILGTIVFRLLFLQVYKYDEYKEKADVSSTRFIAENAPRGIIYDSDGNILASNTQTYVLTYMEAEEATGAFYSTMAKVFNILKENNESFNDDLSLKINSEGEFYFDFKVSSEDAKKSSEIRFKRDRGMNESIENELYKDKSGDLTDAEIERVNEKLLAITPEETFYYLINQYDLFELLLPDGYTIDEYNTLYKKYNNSGSKLTSYEIGELIFNDIVSNGYSIEDIRKYVVVKDAIKMKSYEGYKAVTIANNIKRDTSFIIYQRLSDLPGIDVSLQPVRTYPYNNLASSVIGYVSSINSSEAESYELRGYDISTDLIGTSGIEAALEDQLKGNKGGTTVKVNSQGRATEELFKLESYPGNNVYLTIDKDVQYAAQEALKDTLERVRNEDGQKSATRGAVVAIEVGTGRVLAMASYPDFNPNDFAISGQLSDELYEKYFSPNLEAFGLQHIKDTGATMSLDELFPKNESGIREDIYDIYPKPLFNYATQGTLQPGSVFKPLTSIAGLMEGVITVNETMNDVGTWSGAGLTVKNFQGSANGVITVKEALQFSSNYFFYETGLRLYLKGVEETGSEIEGLNTLAHYAWKFGLGVEQGKNPSTGIEIYEDFGQTYNFTSWKNAVLGSHMFTLVDYLESGKYGAYYFVPFDIGYKDTDTDELKNLKSSLKEKINSTLEKVGTNEEVDDDVAFKEYIENDVLSIMNTSEEYKKSIANYEKANNTKVTIEDQADIISTIIADYTIFSMTTEIKGPSQAVTDAIGQSMNNFTPLQLANYVATLASGGTRYKVSIVDKITSPTGEVLHEFKPEVVDELDIPEEYLQAVKEGMRKVNTYVNNGLAYECFGNFPIEVVGKTGTADFSTEEHYTEIGRRPHGNYISFAPMDNPKIAIFSTLYDGNKGSSGATVHKAIYEAYFKDELLKINPNYASTSSSFQKYVVNAPADNKETEESNVEANKQDTNNQNTNTETNNIEQ